MAKCNKSVIPNNFNTQSLVEIVRSAKGTQKHFAVDKLNVDLSRNHHKQCCLKVSLEHRINANSWGSSQLSHLSFVNSVIWSLVLWQHFSCFEKRSLAYLEQCFGWIDPSGLFSAGFWMMFWCLGLRALGRTCSRLSAPGASLVSHHYIVQTGSRALFYNWLTHRNLHSWHWSPKATGLEQFAAGRCTRNFYLSPGCNRPPGSTNRKRSIGLTQAASDR